jgi:hypothetical protein
MDEKTNLPMALQTGMADMNFCDLIKKKKKTSCSVKSKMKRAYAAGKFMI